MNLRRLARLALLIIPVAGAAAPMALPQLARAAGATIVVGTFADPALSGTDCTASTGSGTVKCSLRAAVQQANSDNNGDIIQLGAGTYQLTIGVDSTVDPADTGTTGDLDMEADMTLQGAGATQTLIEGVGSPWNDRILEADQNRSNPNVTVQNLKVTGGNDTGNYSEDGGGGILGGDGNLTLHNVIVDNNHSDFDGGGVNSNSLSSETLTITNSTLSNNDANGNGGGLRVGGTTDAANAISNAYITGNTARGGQAVDSGGGGIYDEVTGAGSTTFSDVMVTGNHATGRSGGGVYEYSTANSIYKNITISGNDSVYSGGGFYAAATVTSLTNATITGNSVTGEVSSSNIGGGGIGAGIGGSVTVNNATINGNSSTTQGGGLAAVDSGDHIHLHNTILVNDKVNSAIDECFVSSNGGNAIVSTGYNIVDDNTCALTRTTDRQGSTFNPNLGALQDNTGPVDGAPGDTSPTLTEALPKGSIAIDTADPALANNPATDERGITRPQGTASDVGAYEFIPPVFVAPTLPAAGHLPSGPQSPTLLALLILAAATAVAAVGFGIRAPR